MDLQCYEYAYYTRRNRTQWTCNATNMRTTPDGIGDNGDMYNDAIPLVDHSPSISHCCLLSLSHNPDLNPKLEDVSFVMDLQHYACCDTIKSVTCRSPCLDNDEQCI